MKKLGINQSGALSALKNHGTWSYNANSPRWMWGTKEATKRLLDGLVKRGDVIRETNDDGSITYRPVLS